MNEDPNSAFYLYGFTRSDLVPNETASQPPQTARISPSAPGCIKLGVAGILPAVSGGFQPPGRGPGAFSSGETPDPTPTESELDAALPSAPGTRIAEVAGIDEQRPPFLWCHGDSSAILSLVAREEFCGPAADSNLQDLAWVGPRVCQHQAVLEQARHFAPILPARFGTLFSSIEALARFMDQHQAAIADFLERVAGQEEWAVKGLLDRARAEDALCRQMLAKDQAPLASSPGLAYMQEQRLRIKARQELEDCLAGVCRVLLEELTPLVSETCQRQVLSRETTGADQEMVFNWAFLVPQGAVADFQKRVEEANTSRTLPGLTFAVSGPWPPYSFCPALEVEPA